MVNIAKILVLPPVSLILLMVAGLALRRAAPRLAAVFLVLGVGGFYALSTPIVSRLLASGLEIYAPVFLDDLPQGPQAIVVLAAGRIYDAPDYGGDDVVGLLTLGRLRYSAELHRRTGLPVLVAGGGSPDEPPPLADLMARSLAEDFGIGVEWREGDSLNTAENAFYSATILQQSDIDTVFLVTHAWHMRRAAWVFGVAGLNVVPAPTAFAGHWPDRPREIRDFIPGHSGFIRSSLALHEWLGLLWYRMRYG